MRMRLNVRGAQVNAEQALVTAELLAEEAPRRVVRFHNVYRPRTLPSRRRRTHR